MVGNANDVKAEELVNVLVDFIVIDTMERKGAVLLLTERQIRMSP